MVRYDALLAPDWMYTKFKKTTEGFLTGRAVICSTGVYEYRRADGSIVKELRLPEDVFAPTFLNSLKLKPLTLSHPDELVTADNVKKYQVGTLGDNPSSPAGLHGDPNMAGTDSGYQFFNTDMYHVSIDMMIHDAEAVQAVEDGLRALSVGYTCDLEPAKPGARFLGQSYDFIQRNLIANHLSLVDSARAGDAATIRMDSADAILVTSDNIETGGMSMAEYKSIKLDGVDYTAEPKVLEALHLAQTRADTAEATLATLTLDKSKVEGERDSLKDKADGLEAKVKELEAKRMDEAQVALAVTRRVKILDAARLAEVEVKAGMAEIDIQKAVIVKVFPKANLDGKDAIYIDARFDGAVETLSVKTEENADAATRELNGEAHADEAPVVDSRVAREKMIETLKKGYQVEKK